MQKKKKKTKLFIFLIICFVLVPFLLTKGCNYMESLNQAKNSVSEPITSISEQIQPSASVYTHAHTPARTHSRSHYAGAYAHERAHIRTHNAHVYAQNQSISKANWTGTAVPSSGYVENVYFNNSLSVEETISILDDIEFHINNDTLYYSVVANDTLAYVIGINKINNEYLISLTDNNDGFMIFSSNEMFGFVGWNSEISNPIYFNNYAISNIGSYIIGDQNNELISLFSITPFEDNSGNELSIGNLFAQLANAILLFGVAVVELFLALEPIFWNNGPTLIFILLIAGVAFALASWGLELLISLIGVFKTKRKKKK